ncbi:unnamed protein product [Rodentolepis nana]|uniref:ORF1 n=1 Tax=Rodentolepis nana TaxID=102285 RepID=A0A0R3T353_RODNA|nr:unnamed protein product [Rodentolepis nana]
MTGVSDYSLNSNLSSAGVTTPTVPTISTETGDLLRGMLVDEDPGVPPMQTLMPTTPHENLTPSPQRVTRTNEKALKAAFPGGEGLDSAPNRTRKRKQDNGYEGASETKFRHITASVDDIFLSCKIKHQLEGYPIHQDYPTEGNLGNVHRHKHGYCACLNPYPLGNIAYYLMCDV